MLRVKIKGTQLNASIERLNEHVDYLLAQNRTLQVRSSQKTKKSKVEDKAKAKQVALKLRFHTESVAASKHIYMYVFKRPPTESTASPTCPGSVEFRQAMKYLTHQESLVVEEAKALQIIGA